MFANAVQVHRLATLFRSLPPSSSVSIGSDDTWLPRMLRVRRLESAVVVEEEAGGVAESRSSIIMTACRRLAPTAAVSGGLVMLSMGTGDS